MTSRAADRLLALERQGVIFSRNKNFEVFNKAENRSALRLFRRLQRVGDILTGQQYAPVSVCLQEKNDTQPQGTPALPSHQLCMAFSTIGGTYHAYLFADEYALLWRDKTIASILKENGLPQP